MEKERVLNENNSSNYANGKPIDIPSNKKELEIAIKEWAEGNINLEKAIRQCIENNIITIASCAGHPELGLDDDPYLCIQITNDTKNYVNNIMNNLLDNKKIISACNISKYPDVQGGVPCITLHANPKYKNEMFDLIAESAKKEKDIESCSSLVKKIMEIENKLEENELVAFNFEYKNRGLLNYLILKNNTIKNNSEIFKIANIKNDINICLTDSQIIDKLSRLSEAISCNTSEIDSMIVDNKNEKRRIKMGLLDKFKGKKEEEKKIIDGYEIGVDSGIIYHCPKGLTNYVLPNGSKGLSDIACSEMKQTMENLDVPASFKTFFKEANYPVFSPQSTKNLKSIHFAEGITDINTSIFDAFNVKFNIPKAITQLPKGLYEVNNAGKVVIGNHVEGISELFASHDLSIQEVEISGNLKEIPTYAFNQCKNLRKVILHEGIEKCGVDAFRGTNQLEYIEIPETFNGNFDASMENRAGKSTRYGKEFVYDAKNFEQEKKSILTIKVRRDGQSYTFEIPRGELSKLTLKENIIAFNGKEYNINELKHENIHTIMNGQMKSVEEKKTETQNITKTDIQSKQISQSGKNEQKSNIDYSKYDIKQVNTFIESIVSKTGYTNNYRDLDEDELSYEDQQLLAIALHTKSLLLRDRLKENPSSKQSFDRLNKDIDRLIDLEAIPTYGEVKLDNRSENGKIFERFDKEIEKYREMDKITQFDTKQIGKSTINTSTERKDKAAEITGSRMIQRGIAQQTK